MKTILPLLAVTLATVADGMIGMAFLETAAKSAASKSKWTKFIQA